MKPPTYSLDLPPLTSDALIQQRVSSLIGRAARRQIWFLFLDEQSRQLPLLLPIDDYPSRPDDEDADRFAHLLREVGDSAGAAGVVIVIERFADATVSPSDVAWARALREAAADSPLELRGLLLSHAKGVRWIAADDYL